MREWENVRMRECGNARMQEFVGLFIYVFSHFYILAFLHFNPAPKKITGGESELPVPVIKGGQVNG